MKRSRKIWAGFAGFGVLLVASIMLTGGMYFRQVRNAEDGTPSLNSTLFDQADFSKFNFTLNITVNYLKFEPGDGLTASFVFDPGNALMSDGSPTNQVCLIGYLNALNTNFTQGQLMKSITTVIPINGDINLFPFDTYSNPTVIAATAGPACENPVAIYPTVVGSIQGFTINADAKAVLAELSDDVPVPIGTDNIEAFSVIQLTFTAKRTDVSRAFAVLIFIVMWLLTASIVITTAWYWITGRRVDLPFIALGTAILFALPNIRNAMPGILTRAGLLVDLVGYIWNLILVSLSVVSLTINWIYRKDGKKKKPVAAPKV